MGQFGEDHLLLAETRQPLTKNGISLLLPVSRSVQASRENASVDIVRQPLRSAIFHFGERSVQFAGIAWA